MGNMTLVAPNDEPVATARMGRPTLYSEEKAEQICDVLKEGHSITVACGKSGVPRELFYDWYQQRAEFRHKVDCARANGESIFSAAMRKGAEGDPDYKGDWRAAESVLKRQYIASGWGDQINLSQLTAEQAIAIIQAYQHREANVEVEQAVIESGEGAL